MPIALSERTPVPVDARHHLAPHDPDALLIYRGYAIVGAEEGWDVLDPTRPDADDLGWGADLHQAMSVVNEIVDGGERRIAA